MTTEQHRLEASPTPVELVADGSGPRVWIDQSICIGSGSCVRLARGAFELEPNQQIAYLVDAAAVDAERLRLAERSCPTGAIFIEEG